MVGLDGLPVVGFIVLDWPEVGLNLVGKAVVWVFVLGGTVVTCFPMVGFDDFGLPVVGFRVLDFPTVGFIFVGMPVVGLLEVVGTGFPVVGFTVLGVPVLGITVVKGMDVGLPVLGGSVDGMVVGAAVMHLLFLYTGV